MREGPNRRRVVCRPSCGAGDLESVIGMVWGKLESSVDNVIRSLRLTTKKIFLQSLIVFTVLTSVGGEFRGLWTLYNTRKSLKFYPHSS